MPTAGGPNTLGESNLVFAYDTSDTGNSYRGQPTVNVLPSSNVLLTSYNDHGGVHVTDNNFTLFGNPTLRNTSNPAQDWNGVYLTGLSSILTPGVTYTYSFYIYFTSDNTTISYFGYGAPGYTGVKGKWNRVSTTFTATTQDYFYVTLQYSNGQPFSTYYLANLQIEAKSYPTQFVNGTRSATQGLLPLVGGSALDLSNVSFDSNAQMTFDGTNDYVDLGYAPFSGTGEFTIETVYTLNTTDTHTIIGNYPASSLQFMGRYGLYINGSCYFPSSLGPGTYYAVATRDVSGTCKLYLNGALVSTVTNSNNIGTNSFRIGTNTGGGEVLNGKVPVMRLYNRALTAQEVKQNYQQYKTRFNLS